MIRVLLLFLVVLLSPLQAVVWKDDAFGVSVNLPDSAGWQPIQTGDMANLAVLVSMQNVTRGAVFGVTALINPPNTNLRDPNTQKALEQMLQSFGYRWIGSSTVPIGGLEWRQYNVTAGAGSQATSGVVRYTAGNGRIFAVTLLVGDGHIAAQDLELQTTAASFRLYPPVAGAPRAPVTSTIAGTSPSAPGSAPGQAPAAPGQPDGPTVSSGSMTPLLIGGGAALLFIIVLLAASRGGKKS